ncbi:MAG: DUF4340 domain-containing protein [Candidatus Latescibacteria bacterium]|nr:DUF4340 domain-containing protein [Candidatus Latescibacterota bacterium]
MRFRNTAILGAILLALASYFYFFEVKAKSNEQKSDANKVFAVDQTKITRVKVTYQGQTTVCERDQKEGWRIVEPLSVLADAQAVTDILNTIASLTPARTVTDSAAHLADYGLDPPQAVVEVSAGLTAPQTLLLGEDNPTGSSTFAATKGSRKVFLIETGTGNTLRKTTSALRDRRIVHVQQDKVDRVEVEYNDTKGVTTLVCERDTLGSWRLTKPVDMPAERNEAINLVGALAGLKAMDFVADDPPDLKPYGLHRPIARALLRSRDGSVNATILVGQRAGAQVYVTSNERNTVYAISAENTGQFLKNPQQFHKTTAFDFQSYKVTKVDWKLGPELVTCVKRAFEDWQMLFPLNTRADDRAITALLDSLEIMKIKEFIPATPAKLAQYGLDRPPVTVTCYVEDQRLPQQILVGTADEQGRTIYVKNPRENWIYAVNATVFNQLPTTAADLRDKRVLRFKGYDVNVFEVVQGAQRLRVRRDQKQKTIWRLEEPVRKEANAVAVGQAFAVLDTLRTLIFVTNEEAKDLSRFGLDKPSMEVHLTIGGRGDVPEERLSLLVGKPFPSNKMVYVKRRDSPEIYLVDSKFVQVLTYMIRNTPVS